MTGISRRTVLAAASLASVVGLAAAARLSGQAPGLPSTKNGDWTHYTADVRGSRYSPLDQINASNFNELEVAWRFKTDNLGTRPEFKLEGTPLMVKGVVYATGGTRRSVVALDAKSWRNHLGARRTRRRARRGGAASALGPRPVATGRTAKATIASCYVTTGLSPGRAQREDRHADQLVRQGRHRRHEGRRAGRQGRTDRSRDRRNRSPLDADRRQGRRHRRVVVPRRADGQDPQQHQGTRARVGRRRPASCCGPSTRFRGPASSATTRGKRNRGRSTATPACGRRSPSTRKPGSCICRSRIRRRTSTAAIVPATTCSATASSAST